jgi:hypothetical protein
MRSHKVAYKNRSIGSSRITYAILRSAGDSAIEKWRNSFARPAPAFAWSSQKWTRCDWHPGSRFLEFQKCSPFLFCWVCRPNVKLRGLIFWLLHFWPHTSWPNWYTLSQANPFLPSRFRYTPLTFNNWHFFSYNFDSILNCFPTHIYSCYLWQEHSAYWHYLHR